MNLFNFFTPKNETFYLQANSTVRQALEKFDAHKFSVVSLVDEDGKFVGTISQGDILRFIKNVYNFDIGKAESIKISEVEKYRPYKPINVESSIDEAIVLALDQNFVPIIDDRGIYIGILKRKTILEYLLVRKIDKK